jgi:hypothetical protein
MSQCGARIGDQKTIGPFMKFSVLRSQFSVLSRLAVIAALLLTSSASAATVRAYVQPASARPNQVINYVITVQDGQVQSLPNRQYRCSC